MHLSRFFSDRGEQMDHLVPPDVCGPPCAAPGLMRTSLRGRVPLHRRRFPRNMCATQVGVIPGAPPCVQTASCRSQQQKARQQPRGERLGDTQHDPDAIRILGRLRPVPPTKLRDGLATARAVGRVDLDEHP